MESLSIIDSVKIGQSISCDCSYTKDNGLVFTNLGNAKLPLLDNPIDKATDSSGSFNWICIGEDYQGNTLLLADRCLINFLPVSDAYLERIINSCGDSIKIDGREYILKLPSRNMWKRVVVEGEPGTPKESDMWHWDKPCYTYEAIDANNMWAVGGETAGTESSASYFNANDCYMRPVLTVPKANRGRGKVGCTLPLPPKGVKITPVVAVPCRYTVTTKGSIGTFSKFGVDGTDYISAEGEPTPDGIFYWICIGFTHQGYLKFVADRNIQNNINWTTLDEAGYTTTEGVITNIDGRDGFRLRLPGTIPDHICDSSHYGEWDGIITLYNKGGIKPSDPSIWNIENTISWTMTPFFDDPVNYIVGRGMQNMQDNLESGIAQKKIK